MPLFAMTSLMREASVFFTTSAPPAPVAGNKNFRKSASQAPDSATHFLLPHEANKPHQTLGMQKLDAGKALLSLRALDEFAGDMTRMAQTLKHVPALPAFTPIELLAKQWLNPIGAASSHPRAFSNKLALATPKTSPEGYLAEPQGATLLPGSSGAPNLPRIEGLQADREAGKVAVTGKPIEHWKTSPEQLVPVGRKLSDFIYLAEEKNPSSANTTAQLGDGEIPLVLEMSDSPTGIAAIEQSSGATVSAFKTEESGQSTLKVSFLIRGNLPSKSTAEFAALAIKTEPKLLEFDRFVFWGVDEERTVESYHQGKPADETVLADRGRALLRQLGYEAVGFSYHNFDAKQGVPELETAVRRIKGETPHNRFHIQELIRLPKR